MQQLTDCLKKRTYSIVVSDQDMKRLCWCTIQNRAVLQVRLKNGKTTKCFGLQNSYMPTSAFHFNMPATVKNVKIIPFLRLKDVTFLFFFANFNMHTHYMKLTKCHGAQSLHIEIRR